MEGFQSRLLKEIENAGKHIYKYWQISLKYDVDFRTNDVRDFLKNSVKAVKWFCGQTFFAGRQDWLSDSYRRAFFAAFDQTFNGTIDASKISDKTGLLVERFKKNVNEIRKKGGESYKTRKKDEDAFKNALKFVAENMDLRKKVSGMEDGVPSIKEVVDWHKNIKIEQQLEEESRKFRPYPPQGWREQRKKELLEGGK